MNVPRDIRQAAERLGAVSTHGTTHGVELCEAPCCAKHEYALLHAGAVNDLRLVVNWIKEADDEQ